MLRVTTDSSPGSLTFKVEGRLAGPWVRELERCWHSAMSGSEIQSVCVDLAAVTYVDAVGEELLKAMHHRGARLQAADCLMKSIVEAIVGPPGISELESS